MNWRKFIVYWLPVVLWAGVISFFSTGYFTSEHTGHILGRMVHWLWWEISTDTLHAIHIAIRKLAHVVEYAVFGLLVYRALRAGAAARWKQPWLWTALALVVVMASLDEFHQSFVAGRGASVWDVALDSLGGGLGLLAIWLRSRVFARNP